jgi:hypothetical protein
MYIYRIIYIYIYPHDIHMISLFYGLGIPLLPGKKNPSKQAHAASPGFADLLLRILSHLGGTAPVVVLVCKP